MAIIFGIGAFQAVLFSLLLILKKEKKHTDVFLSAFFFVIALYFSHLVSFFYSIWQIYPDIVLLITLVPLFYGPLLFFYVRSLIHGQVKIKELLIHAIPILLTFLIILPYISLSYQEKLVYFTGKFIDLPLYLSMGIFMQYLSAPVYFIWIIILLRKHDNILKLGFSALKTVNLSWLKALLIGAISIWLLDVINVIVLNYTSLIWSVYISWSIKFVFLIFSVLMGFFALKQGQIFTGNTDSNSSHKKTEKKLQPISSDELERIKKLLEDYMDEEKAYRNSELRIQDVSNALKIPVHQLSHVLNTILELSFYDFVNQYRVEEVKQKLENPEYDHLTLIAIAFDSGFNSKASFNRLFKQQTKQTPSQYKKLQRNI